MPGDCPKCGNHTYLFKCKFCGDIRCSSWISAGSKTQKGCAAQHIGAGNAMQCRVCKKGGAYQSLK